MNDALDRTGFRSRRRRMRGRQWIAALAAFAALAVFATLPALAQTRPPQGPGIQGPILYDPVAPKVYTGNLTNLPKARAWRIGDPVREVEDLKRLEFPPNQRGGAEAPDISAAAGGALVTGVLGAPPTTSPLSFDGIPATIYTPPDTVGDIGPNHYLQAVNASFAIFNRNGSLLAGPSPISSLWAGLGGPCDAGDLIDPIVRYDHLADRWLLSGFPFSGGVECIAISRTGDPITGGWFLYSFLTPAFPDYPKIGVWPDGYYMGTQRGFPGGGLDVFAFDRARMLQGLPAGQVQFVVPAPSLFLLPSDLDGPSPPVGTPNFFVRHVDGDQWGGADRLDVFAFHVDWANPVASTFTSLPSLPTAAFNAVLCGDNFLGTCVSQPGTAMKLETLPAWMMWRLQYRNFGSHETLVTNHTVNVGGDHAGIRWYELRRSPGGAWNLFQEGTFSPDEGAPGPADDPHRWMASAAMNRDGCLALGYSASSNVLAPSIRFTGRQPADPAGAMSQGEVTLVNGGGAQTGSLRWGNYSTMDVDPLDDRSFWYTTEYYTATSSGGWSPRISSFELSGCGPNEPELEPLRHRVSLSVGGVFTDGSLPLNSGFEIGFRYQRHRFLPQWSWELETNIAGVDDGANDGLLGSAELHLVRHLRTPPAKVQPFLLVGIGGSHYNTLGSSDTAFQVTLGGGAEFEWSRRVGFRLDARVVWLNDLLSSGWTTNAEILWGPTFSF